MQKRVKNIIVITIGIVALSFVSIAGGVLPISALTGEPNTTNETRTSASQTDVMIDLSDFFEQPGEDSEIEYGDNEFIDPFSPIAPSDNVMTDETTKNMLNENSTNASETTNVNSNSNSEIKVSLLYNNSYSEKVLIEGETLSAEVYVSNPELLDEIAGFIVCYSGGKMISVDMATYEQSPIDENSFIISSVIPMDSNITNAKVFVFKSLQSLSPFGPSIEIKTINEDYYGNTFTSAQSISDRNSADGCINSENDVDVFSFVPQNDGLYYFETFSDIDTYAVLYNSDNIDIPIVSGDNEGVSGNFRISQTLEAGKTYYLYVYGRSMGEYSLNYGYAVGSIFGTVSPVEYCDDDMIFNEEIETAINLKTYSTGEHIATLHLKDWSQSNAEYASFSIMGIHAGEYIVEVTRPGYITYLKRIELDDDVIDLGSIELIPGDVNSDGVVDSADIMRITELNGSIYGDDNYIISADFNGDKTIDSSDMSVAEANIDASTNSYGQNIVIPTINLQVEDSNLYISGIAKADTMLNCHIYLVDTRLYEETVVCESNGTYEFTIELNRTGQYKVEMFEETSVLSSSQTLNYE